MVQETPDKLVAMEIAPSRTFFFAIPVTEDDTAEVMFFDPCVGDGHAMDIAGQVTQDSVSLAGIFGVDNPG